VDVKLLESEIAMLGEMTAPPVQYPAWFTAATTDPVQQEALTEAPVRLATGTSGS
jgi:hypothetical protein